jgi:hypothetical protein
LQEARDHERSGWQGADSARHVEEPLPCSTTHNDQEENRPI